VINPKKQASGWTFNKNRYIIIQQQILSLKCFKIDYKEKIKILVVELNPDYRLIDFSENSI
jgi:hypothetical protein